MAGILANSASVTMLAGDTSADNSVTGYLVSEQITLTASPAGSNYRWAISKPSSSTARSDLSASTGASVTFRPDVEGYYVIALDVDEASYVIRIASIQVGTVSTLSAVRLLPVADSQVPAPATGATIYFSSTQSALSMKLADGSVNTINITAV